MQPTARCASHAANAWQQRGAANREDALQLGDQLRDVLSKFDGMGTGQKWD
jgi:hypothetical protein